MLTETLVSPPTRSQVPAPLPRPQKIVLGLRATHVAGNSSVASDCTCMQGEVPPVQAALDLYHILSESDTNLRQPVGLEKQLLSEYSLDADVGQSILQMLQVIHLA